MGEEAKQEEAPKTEEVAAGTEEKKEEEKVEEKKEEEEPKPAPPPPPPPSPLVLSVELHCMGCAKKIEKSLMRIRGVEGVVIDMVENQVTIKGVVEHQAVCNKIMKKTKRKPKILSPQPEAEGQPIPEIVTSQVSGLTTVELNINMHCEACALQLKKKILKMRGVQSAETELSSGKVTVTGTMDGDKLVEHVYRRTKKQAKIVPQPEPEPEKQEEEKAAEEPKTAAEEVKKEEEAPAAAAAPAPAEEEKKEEVAKEEEEKVENMNNKNMMVMMMMKEEESMKRAMMNYYQPIYVIDRIPPAPQLFSDENPNACCIS